MTILCILLKNRYSVQLYALADSRVNRFIFINIIYAINVVKHLNIKARKLLIAIIVKGYNSVS